MTATRVKWDGGRARQDVAAALMLLVLGSAAVSGCDRTTPGSGDLEGDLRLAASDVRILATSDLIAGVEDLEVASDGRVWLQNSLEPLFIGLGPDDGVVRAFGRMGGGPEEFRRPSGFVAGGADGQVWVFDRGHHALFEVAGPEPGRLVLPLPQDAIPPGTVTPGMRIGWSDLVRTARLGEEVILPRRADTSEPGIQSVWLSAWTADLVGLDPRTGSVRTIVKLGDILGDPRPHFDLEGAFLPFPLWFRLWAVCSETEIYLYDRLQNEVRRFTGDGEERTAISLPPVRRVSMSTREFAQALFFVAAIEAAPAVPPDGRLEMSPADSARILEGLRARLTAPPDRLADLLPRYLNLRCDEEGTLWLQPFDIGAGGLEGGPTWLRITLDGSRSEVRFPDGFDPLRFTSEWIWGVHRDELGVASVAFLPAPGHRTIPEGGLPWESGDVLAIGGASTPNDNAIHALFADQGGRSMTASIYGTWKHHAAYGDSSVTITQIIQEDGSYETVMMYLLEAGCRQEIHHYGQAEVRGSTLRLTLDSGQTRMIGCDDPSRNFEMRDFTEEELLEARRLLDQDMAYTIEHDTLTTVVRGPMGKMDVTYTRI